MNEYNSRFFGFIVNVTKFIEIIKATKKISFKSYLNKCWYLKTNSKKIYLNKKIETKNDGIKLYTCN